MNVRDNLSEMQSSQDGTSFTGQPLAELVMGSARVSAEPYTILAELKTLRVYGSANMETKIPPQQPEFASRGARRAGKAFRKGNKANAWIRVKPPQHGNLAFTKFPPHRESQPGQKELDHPLGRNQLTFVDETQPRLELPCSSAGVWIPASIEAGVRLQTRPLFTLPRFIIAKQIGSRVLK